MISQGRDSLSRGILLEGVNRGENMLSFVDLARMAIERQPGVLEFVRSWLDPIVGESKCLKPEEWFKEGHGIIGGEKDGNGMWKPCHAEDGRAYIWTPPPVVAGVCKGDSQEDRCLPCFSYSSPLLPPVDVNVVQSIRLCV